MAKWKYTEEKKRTFAIYLRFEEDKEKTITVSDWTFPKGGSYLFRAFVTKEDGEETDKIWTVWDYESAQALKKKLGTKYVAGTKELKVTMKKNEEDDSYFEIRS